MHYVRRVLVLAGVLLACASEAFPVSCPVVTPPPLSEGQQALLHSDFEKAATLFTQALAQNPNDAQLTSELAETLLKQQKVQDADALISKAVQGNSKSVILETELGFVQYREGLPWLAAQTLRTALAIDPCYPRAHLLNMYVLRLNSMYKSADSELRIAHQLDPVDPEIRRYWLQTLPLTERISELEAYLAAANGEEPDDLRRMRLYLERLKKMQTEQHKSCQLASSDVSTNIPFAPLLRDATHIRAFGLDVKLNDHTARLEIDTGASGLLISRSVAKAAGLEKFSDTEVHGVGSGNEKAAYTAYVDSIKVGSLEFHDCSVTVLDSRSVGQADGLIGMDVFSNLLVTLDYPMRQLKLAPLPPRPNEAAGSKPALETSEAENSARTPHDRYVAPEMKDWARVYRSGHHLILPARLNGSETRLFILDTGAFATSMSPDAGREVTKLHGSNLVVRGVNGQVAKTFSADNVTFEFANIRQRAENVVAFDMSGISRSSGMDISGFIGFATLKLLTLRIDYRDALVEFQYDPNRGYR